MTVKEQLHQIVEALPEEIPERVIEEAETVFRRYQGIQAGAYLEYLEQRARETPAEVLEALPTDLADNVDHYAYGIPKR